MRPARTAFASLCAATLLIAGLSPWPSTAGGLQSAPEVDPLPRLDPQVTRSELVHHLRFLASDELRGREAGTPDAVRAARYLGRVLEAAGLEPAGTDGSFLQEVPLVRIVHQTEPTLVLETWGGERVEGRFGIDFDVSPQAEPKVAASLDLLVVRALEDLPEEARSDRALWIDGSRSERRAWLSARGMGEGEGWGLCVARGFSRERNGRSLPDPKLMRESPEADPADLLRLHGPLRELLEEGAVKRIELAYGARVERVLDFNVVGVLRGVDPDIGDEAVVLSAHYDHIGVLPPRADGDPEEDEDRVYNGADDDASGTAAVLEIAHALATGAPPARTAVFLLAAGEEKGLLGTYHYLDHPAVPLEQTVANLNLEMIGRPDELAGGPGRLWLTGFERTNLGTLFQEGGVEIAPDARPEQNFFLRSDNVAFVERGIVGQTLSSYNLHRDYHRVTDEVERLDLDHLEQATRVALAATRLLVHGRPTPEWLPGGMPTFR